MQVSFGNLYHLLNFATHKLSALKIFTTKEALRQYLSERRNSGDTIGFVPTMGALHPGHISLIEQARKDNGLVVCSIFVNPTQFNDPADLEKYPRTIEADTRLLERHQCDVLFCPAVTEIYDANESWHFDIGEPERLLEGEFRPGHYQGVTQVVYKLLDIVKPDIAYFGQKDFQQFMIISLMVQRLYLPVKLVMCPIKREDDGLAMSSRNVLLSAADRQNALVLSQTLNWVKENFDRRAIPALKAEAERRIAAQPGINPDYFEIADAETLHPAQPDTPHIVALVAAKAGNTRLIDNVLLTA